MKENLTELVAVRLFKDNDKYNSDVFVSVNCRRRSSAHSKAARLR